MSTNRLPETRTQAREPGKWVEFGWTPPITLYCRCSQPVSPSNFRSLGVGFRSTKTISDCRQRHLINRNSPGPLWRSAGGETAVMSDCRHTQTVGKCVELLTVAVPSLVFRLLNSHETKEGITSWIARWVSSSGLHPTRVLPET